MPHTCSKPSVSESTEMHEELIALDLTSYSTLFTEHQIYLNVILSSFLLSQILLALPKMLVVEFQMAVLYIRD